MADVDFCPTCGASWDCEHSGRTEDESFRLKEPTPVDFRTQRPISKPRLGDRYDVLPERSEPVAKPDPQRDRRLVDQFVRLKKIDEDRKAAREARRSGERAMIEELVKVMRDAS